jgi:intein-encoded DNA endonuclease-like protein
LNEKGRDWKVKHRKELPITGLSIEARIQAFNLAINLKRQGMRTIGIYNQLGANGFPVKYETVRAWVTGVHNPTRKLNLVRHEDGNLVELIGMTVGDGNWRKILEGESYQGGSISYASKDIELATRAGMLMGKVLGKNKAYRPFWSGSNNVYVVYCGSKHLVEILSDAFRRLGRLLWKYRIRFLRGIYNAEGCVNLRKRRDRVYPRIYLTNSSLEILRLVRGMLRSFNIDTTLELNTKAGKKKIIRGKPTVTNANVYNICIGGRQHIITFAKRLCFDIRRKQSLLEEAVNAIRAARGAGRSDVTLSAR